MDNDDREAYRIVTAGYYRNPDAGLATRALRHWLGGLAGADDSEVGRMMVVFYLFARISQVSEPARDAFAPLLRAYDGPHAAIPRRLQEATSDPAFPRAMQVPIERPESLDLLWAEFFVTGQAEPVERIFTTLDGNDRVRERLTTWLAERALFGGAKRRASAELLAAAGIVVDLERRTIVTAGDLDCLCFAIAEQRVPIFKMLPFELTPEEVMTLATKASALWSLRLNARDHDKVAEVCRVWAQRPGGPARRLATEPVGDVPPYAL
jgi:hypothetical protein